MTDRFDEAKRALEGVPTHDVWAEAERRATAGDVVPLAPVPTRGSRRPGRWLAAAAAAIALVAGTVAVLADDGDEAPVEAGSDTSDPEDAASPEVTTYQADGACKLGITGEPLPEPVTVSPAETFAVDDDGRAAVGTLVEGDLNPTQTFAVQVPGQVVIDLVGERVEDIGVERGTAQLWFQTDGAVQLRWFTGSQEACDSFTVTVAGGTEDENRHAAVDLGERVLMSRELPGCCEADPDPAGNPLAHTTWQLESSTLGGEPTRGGGLVFTFGEDSVSWTDGCNTKSASYTYAADILRLGLVTTTYALCEPNPTSDAVNGVMVGEGVGVSVEGPLLELRTLEGLLVLRPTEAP